MEFSENFNTRCNIEKAIYLTNYLTVDISMLASECYTNAFYNTEGETLWKQHRGLDAVYVLGFISGCRAIRERQKEKRQA